MLIGGRYEVLDEIDSGGFGEVYKARDTAAGAGATTLALKILRLERLSDPGAVSRFKREIKFGVKLPHPNLMPLLDHGDDGGTLWFVMPFADGGTLTSAVPKGGFDPAGVLSVLVPVASAVEFLHANGALHRDISSNNILRSGSEWMLSDLGLSVSSLIPTSYLTSTDVAGLGHVGYVAPEQRAALKNAITRSDIYSLGKLVQFLSEGVWPEHLPNSAGPFAAVIGQATRTHPQHRYATVRDLVDAVRVVATAPPVTGTVADRVEDILKTPRHRLAAKGVEIAGLINNLDPHDEYDRKHIQELLRAASQTAWKFAFDTNPDQALLAIDTAAEAIYDEAEFRKLDGLLQGMLNADRAIDTPQVRHRVVATLAHVGSSNDQWSYRRRLVELLIDRTPAHRMQATLSGFREAGKDAAQWVLLDARLDVLPNPLRGWLADFIA
nr:serine/threonine-protein kinase [Microbacterium sp. CFH 90308]